MEDDQTTEIDLGEGRSPAVVTRHENLIVSVCQPQRSPQGRRLRVKSSYKKRKQKNYCF